VALENVAIGMIMTSADGHTLRVNRALCQMLSYSAEALHASSFSAFTHP
jgi:PAS domain S-box-containing protein